MGYKKSNTNCSVAIVHLKHLNEITLAKCHALRQEAGRCWTDMVKAHVSSRDGVWLTTRQCELQFKTGYQIHSQSVQALAQKLQANVETALELKKNNPKVELPYKEKPFQTVTWKKDGIRQRDGKLILSNGRGREPIIFSLAEKYQGRKIQQVELTWDVDHYCLCLNIDTETTDQPQVKRVKSAGIDMGEIHVSAITTDDGASLIISGRALRSAKRLRNKRHSSLSEKLSRCKNGSKRHKRLSQAKRRASSKFEKQQRDILHKASRQTVAFCVENNVANIGIGDVRDIADGDSGKGRHHNQRMSQWAHGTFRNYVAYKARFFGMRTDLVPEPYTSKTCSHCKRQLASSPRGRNFKCPGCGVSVHRDANGSANICSRYRFGELGRVQSKTTTYLQPVDYRRQGCSRALEAGQTANAVCC